MPEWSLAALRNLLPQMSGANFGTTSPQEDADMPLTGLDKAVKYALPFSAPPPSPQDQTVAYRTPYGNITEGDIGRATDVAMATSGGGLSTKGIKAYHSSPHDFDRFDLSKIGTGEGAQVYGHGLYFAENPAVSGQGGQYWQQFRGQTGNYNEQMAAKHLQNAGFDNQAAAANVQKQIDDLTARLKTGDFKDIEGLPTRDRPREFYEEVLREHQTQRDMLLSGKPVGPRTYEVNINADPAHFLDWGKPLREQSDQVRNALRTVKYKGDVFSDSIGSDLYRAAGTPERATSMFNERGIPGIKYLDEGSRNIPGQISINRKIMNDPNAPQHMRDGAAADLARWEAEKPTSNYVVFNPGIIDIMKKYGLAGLAPAGAAAYGAAGGQGQSEQGY